MLSTLLINKELLVTPGWHTPKDLQQYDNSWWYYSNCPVIELNRGQSNIIEQLGSIEVGNRTQSNQTNCVRVRLHLISKPNRTQSNLIKQCKRSVAVFFSMQEQQRIRWKEQDWCSFTETSFYDPLLLSFLIECMPTSATESNQTQSKFDWVRLLQFFCESLIVFDCRTQSNPIVWLSSTNETFDLVRVVSSGIIGWCTE